MVRQAVQSERVGITGAEFLPWWMPFGLSFNQRNQSRVNVTVITRLLSIVWVLSTCLLEDDKILLCWYSCIYL